MIECPKSPNINSSEYWVRNCNLTLAGSSCSSDGLVLEPQLPVHEDKGCVSRLFLRDGGLPIILHGPYCAASLPDTVAVCHAILIQGSDQWVLAPSSLGSSLVAALHRKLYCLHFFR